jgi:alpha-N-arabinofuranosidase
MEARKFPEVRWASEAIRDDFDDITLGFDWVFLRNPALESWSLRENKVLFDDAPAFVGRRLQRI